MLQSHRLIRPEHLNHYGTLFGGIMLQWVDELAYIAAQRDHPGHRFATKALADVVFRRAIHPGSVLRFAAELQRRGSSSVTYRVTVYADDLQSGEETTAFDTQVTLVSVDEQGHKQPIQQ